MNKNYLRTSTMELIRELCRLVDAGESMTRHQFHDLCEQEGFIDFIASHYSGSVRLDYLDKQHTLCKPDVLEYLNNALNRHANVVVMEQFGLNNNALLLGVNLCLLVLEELEIST